MPVFSATQEIINRRIMVQPDLGIKQDPKSKITHLAEKKRQEEGKF
jgi:hypothetical protein